MRCSALKNGEIRIIGVKGIPEISKGDDVGEIIVDALRKHDDVLKDNDIVVVTQKIISKAEGRIRALDSYKPSKRAVKLAAELGKDPKQVQAILEESRRIVKAERGIIIAETKHGLICANAGIDQSNLKPNTISLLPEDPDASARKIRNSVKKRAGVSVAVIISDTFGRPFREGQANVAIGVAGLKPMKDYRGKKDGYGNILKVTVIAVADQVASAAELAMGKLDRVPVSIIRGYKYQRGDEGSKELIRPFSNNLFR